MKIGPQGQAVGTVATAPQEVDAIIRKAYGKIYKGNSSDQQATMEKYFEDYDKYVFKMPEAEVEDITGNDVKVICNEAKHTAGGMDQWTPADFTELSDLAYQHLADMMNAIEKGADWP